MGTPKWTVYSHTHVESGRRYIGLTARTMMFRWNQHVANAQRKRGRGRVHFWNAIRKYGKDAFSHEVLEVCPTLEEGNLAEERWIEYFKTQNPEFGFNLAPGGRHKPGVNTLESKAKRSAASKAAMARPETRAKRKVFQEDPAYRARISATTKAALADPAVRAKIVAANRAALLDSGLQERKRAAVKAAEQRPEVVAKLSAASKARWARPEYRARALSRECSEETRARISAASTGKRHTPESVERQRELYLQRSSTCKFCDSPIEGKRTCIKGRVACQWCFFLHKSGRACFLRPDGSFI